MARRADGKGDERGPERPQARERALLIAGLQRTGWRGPRGFQRRRETPEHGNRDAKAEEEDQRERVGRQHRCEPAKIAGAEIETDRADGDIRQNETTDQPEHAADDADRRAFGDEQDTSRRRVTPSTRSSASCARRRTTASACVEKTSRPPVNSATSARTFMLTRYERDRLALAATPASGRSTASPAGSSGLQPGAKVLDVDAGPDAEGRRE